MGNINNRQNTNNLSEDDQLLTESKSIRVALDGQTVDRECTIHELRLFNKKYTKDERCVIRMSYSFYISLRLLHDNDNVVARLSKYFLKRDKFISYIHDAWLRALIEEYDSYHHDYNILHKLLKRRITFDETYSNIATIGDVEYNEVKAILRISHYTKSCKFNIISDLYQLREYITTLDKSLLKRIKYYILVRYNSSNFRLYFVLVTARRVLSIIDNIDDTNLSSILGYN